MTNQVTESSVSPIQQVTMKFQLKGKGALITWQADVLGQPNTTFKIPYTFDKAALPLVIKALDAIQYPDHPLVGPKFNNVEQAMLTELGLWDKNRVISTIAEKVGWTIYNSLGFRGITILEAVRNYASAQGLTTNYVLRFPKEAVNLAALPWELIRDINETLLFGRRRSHSIERYIDIDTALPKPLPKGHKPHLLALLPYHNVPKLIRDAERNVRLSIWRKLQEEGRITFDEISPLTPRTLTEYLHRTGSRRPDVIHYFGHGTYREGKGYLVFDEDDEGISESKIYASQLAVMLSDIPLVVFQACQSGMANEEGGLLTGIAPTLSLANSAVVAMQLSVRTAAAIRFTEVFYDDLLSKHRSLQEAVAEGRKTLFFEYGELTNWYVPTLYIRSRDQGPIYLTE